MHNNNNIVNSNTAPGKLYLIPTPLHPGALDALPEVVKITTLSLKYFVVETEKQARRFLFSLHKKYPHHPWDFKELQFYSLNSETRPSINTLQNLLAPITQGHSMGLLSDCGAPAIADPGTILVNIAHQMEIPVVPFVGPSSLFLALMASGLNGQNFQFHGYLPAKSEARKEKLISLDKQCQKSGQTQLFIETPYRNQALFEDILRYCSSSLLLCIAMDLQAQTERIHTLPISQWKKKNIELHKKPCIFLLGTSPL